MQFILNNTVCIFMCVCVKETERDKKSLGERKRIILSVVRC